MQNWKKVATFPTSQLKEIKLVTTGLIPAFATMTTITGYAGVIMPYLGDGKTTAALDLKSWQASMVLTDYPEVNIVVFR